MHISSKCSVAIHCLILISEYGTDKRITSELLSRSAGINPATIRGIMSALKKDNMISVRSGTGGAVLCCPPEEINLHRICSAVEPDFLDKLMGVHSTPSQICPVGKNIDSVLEMSYRKPREALSDSLRSVTLSEMIEIYHNRLKNADSPQESERL